MNVLELLQNARELLSDPRKWTKGEFARNATGDEVYAWCDDATCFCLLGSLMKGLALHGDISCGGSLYISAQETLERSLPTVHPSYSDIESFNDNPQTTHADILTLLDRTIERCRNESHSFE